jgi:hypothetical protein
MIFEDFCTPETLRLTIFRPSHWRVSCCGWPTLNCIVRWDSDFSTLVLPAIATL